MKSSRKAPTNIDDYISRFPKEVRATLQNIRDVIRKAAPDAEEAIKYQIPTFVLNENLVHFAAYKKHIGFYPSSSGIAEFLDELSDYHHAKGSVQFPLDQPIPFGLITKIVRFRVNEVCQKRLVSKTKAKKRSPGKRGASLRKASTPKLG